MKKLMLGISDMARLTTIKIHNAITNRKAEGYVDTGVKILIAVVIGALLLSLLYMECDVAVDGELTPKAVIWDDGRRFEIAKVLFQSVDPDEFKGIRYTVIIGSAEKYIYRVDHKWYVMA